MKRSKAELEKALEEARGEVELASLIVEEWKELANEWHTTALLLKIKYDNLKVLYEDKL